MNRATTVLLAAVQAFVVVAVGIAVPVAVGTVVWAVDGGFSADWAVVWRTGGDLWLLGHGVPLEVALPRELTAGLGIEGARDPFALTLAPLGVLLLTVGLGVRAGARTVVLPHRALALVVTLGVFEALVIGVLLLSAHPVAIASVPLALLLPLLAVSVGGAIGWAGGVRRRQRERLRHGADAGPVLGVGVPALDHLLGGTSRGVAVLRVVASGATATLAGVVLVAAVVAAVLLAVGYAQVITLYETLHTGVSGGIAVTVIEASLVPNIVVWTASWLAGPGFALGAGSSVSPAGTDVVFVPPLPVLGALPGDPGAYAYIGMVVPVVVALLVGLAWRQRVRAATGDSIALRLVVAVATAAVAGLGAAGLAALSGGAAGPGRLAEIGPDPTAFGLAIAAEVVVPLLLGTLVPVPSRAPAVAPVADLRDARARAH